MQLSSNHCASSANTPKALYSRREQTIIDIVESGKCKASGLTVAQALLQYPESEVLPIDQAVQIRDQSKCTAVQEISNAEFIEKLEVLPPMDWHCAKHTESFMLSEFYSGQVTSIYARVGLGIPRFFTFRGSYLLSHAAILAKVTEFIGVKQHEDLAPGIFDVGVLDMNLSLGGRQLHLFTEWVDQAASYRPINGSRLRMLNADLQPWDAVDGRVIGREIASELIALDPAYLVVGEGPLAFPASTRLLDSNLRAELQDYSDPRECIEWTWVESHASMAHVENGVGSGVWDFVVDVAKFVEAENVPTVIKEQLQIAKKNGAAFVLFHQGT